MLFPVVMYGYESWTVKKAEHQGINAFELWYWRRLLWVPLDCKEIQPVHSKGDQSWVFIGRIDVEAETPILWSWSKVLVGSRRWTGRPGMLWFMGSERVGHNLVTELNWTELNLPWFNGPNFPASYAVFTSSDLASITDHIHNWMFLLWLHSFILSVVFSTDLQ